MKNLFICLGLILGLAASTFALAKALDEDGGQADYNPPSNNGTIVDPTRAWVINSVQPQNNYDRDFGELHIYTDVDGPEIGTGSLIPMHIYALAEGYFAQKISLFNTIYWPTSSGWRHLDNQHTTPMGFTYFPTRWKNKVTNTRQWPFQGKYTFVVEFNNLYLNTSSPIPQIWNDVNINIPVSDAPTTKGDIKIQWPHVRP